MSFLRNTPPDPEEESNERPAEAAPLSYPATVPGAVESYPVYEAEKRPPQALKRARRVGWELVQTLLLAAVIFFAVRAMAQNFRVEGSSMEPGLHDGQYLLVNKAIYFKINLDKLGKYVPFIDGGDHPQRFLFRAPHRGDVIVFRFPGDPSRDFIKRVIGVPGDTIEVVKGKETVDGQEVAKNTVLVNGVALDESYITHLANYDFPKVVVPAGQYFVLGDNRANSYDSHIWAEPFRFVPEENIIGQAMVSYWPLSDFGGVGNRSIDLGFIKVPFP